MQDSDSHFDVSSPVHNASSDRILELEETLEGKELAIILMQQELEDANQALVDAQDHHAQSMQAQAQQYAEGSPGGTGAGASPLNNIDAHHQAGDNHHWQSASVQVGSPVTLTLNRQSFGHLGQCNVWIGVLLVWCRSRRCD